MFMYKSGMGGAKTALTDTRAQLAQAQMQTQAAMVDLALIAATRQDEGSDDHNLSLSQRRADSVRGYLVSRGISPERRSDASATN